MTKFHIGAVIFSKKPVELFTGPLPLPEMPSPICNVPPLIFFWPPVRILTVAVVVDVAAGSITVTVPPLQFTEVLPFTVKAVLDEDKILADWGSILILPAVMLKNTAGEEANVNAPNIFKVPPFIVNLEPKVVFIPLNTNAEVLKVMVLFPLP